MVETIERNAPVRALEVELHGLAFHATDIGTLFGDVYSVSGTVSCVPKADVQNVV